MVVKIKYDDSVITKIEATELRWRENRETTPRTGDRVFDYRSAKRVAQLKYRVVIWPRRALRVCVSDGILRDLGKVEVQPDGQSRPDHQPARRQRSSTGIATVC